jgi:hypothetical protein
MNDFFMLSLKLCAGLEFGEKLQYGRLLSVVEVSFLTFVPLVDENQEKL